MSPVIKSSLALLVFGCAAPIPAQYDHPFTGRKIVEYLDPGSINRDPRCRAAWDVSPGAAVYACSWHFPDGLNPGQQACHLILPPGNPTLDRIENANCNGWHDRQADAARK